METKTVTLQVKVSDAVRDQLRVQAALDRKTLAEFMRQLAQEALAQRGIEIDMSEGLDSWGGAGRKGKTETAE